jgi:hypothetical protein
LRGKKEGESEKEFLRLPDFTLTKYGHLNYDKEFSLHNSLVSGWGGTRRSI